MRKDVPAQIRNGIQYTYNGSAQPLKPINELSLPGISSSSQSRGHAQASLPTQHAILRYNTLLVGLQTSVFFPSATSSACTKQRSLEDIGKIHCSKCEQKQAIYEHTLAIARVAQKIKLREPCPRRLGAPGGQQAGEVRGEPLFCWLAANGRTRLTSTKSAGLFSTRMHLQRKGTAILPTALG
jgi:hypothetical protein